MEGECLILCKQENIVVGYYWRLVDRFKIEWFWPAVHFSLLPIHIRMVWSVSMRAWWAQCIAYACVEICFTFLWRVFSLLYSATRNGPVMRKHIQPNKHIHTPLLTLRAQKQIAKYALVNVCNIWLSYSPFCRNTV